MVNMDYQAQGFCGMRTGCSSATAALKQANMQLHAAIQNTPVDKRPEYRSLTRWEGDGYAWYWVLR